MLRAPGLFPLPTTPELRQSDPQIHPVFWVDHGFKRLQQLRPNIAQAGHPIFSNISFDSGPGASEGGIDRDMLFGGRRSNRINGRSEVFDAAVQQ